MLYIVIPTFNEEQVITEVIAEIKQAGFDNIIVIDDGSYDQTYEKAKKIKDIIALKHFINRGKGAAIKTGIEAAKLLNADVVVTMDGDGQHNPADIPLMVKQIKEGYDIVLGNRFSQKNQIPFHKKILNYLGNFFTWFFYGLWVNDSQSGFRAYSQKAIRCIETKTDRYEYDSEVIREIKLNQLRYIELPIKVRYTAYSQSKLHRQNIHNGLKTVFKMMLSALK
jgi:glycosyltransferase involved in cell wall biosynthesis